MSIVEEASELVEEDLEEEALSEISERIASRTLPGESNENILDGLNIAPSIVDEFLRDTNNWFEIYDVRVHDDDTIGIPCEYRWTIIRWVQTDMDEWLVNNGWTVDPHLWADSRDHEDDQLEARYKKKYGGVTVYMNAYVEFPPRVFDALNEGRDIEIGSSVKDDDRQMDEIINELREK